MVLTLRSCVLYRSRNKVHHFPYITEYQEYFLGDKGSRCVGLTTLPPSCADCLEIWSLIVLEPLGPVQACNGIAVYFDCLVLYNRGRNHSLCGMHWVSMCLFVCYWRDSPHWARASSFTRFLDHTQRRTTVGRTPLDEWSAHRRDLYLTTHNTHNRQMSMPPVGFEPTTPAGKRLQTYALGRAATGTSIESLYKRNYFTSIKGYQNGSGEVFLWVCLVFPCKYPFTSAPYLFI